ENPHRVHPDRLRPAELAVDALGIEGIGLPHLELVDRVGGDVVRADQPGLPPIPVPRGLLRPACAGRGREGEGSTGERCETGEEGRPVPWCAHVRQLEGRWTLPWAIWSQRVLLPGGGRHAGAKLKRRHERRHPAARNAKRGRSRRQASGGPQAPRGGKGCATWLAGERVLMY